MHGNRRLNPQSAQSDDSQTWFAEDFVDPVSQEFSDDDPWSVSPAADVFDDSTNVTPPVDADEHTDARAEERDAHASEQLPLSFPDDDISEISDLGLADEDDLFSEEPDEDPFADFDEPEPLAEYDSELSETLYVPDAIDSYASQKLRIDEFISEAKGATEEEQAQIHMLMGSMSQARLRRMLSWLKERDWTANSLLLFLEFRLEYWEENQHWWEYTFWNSRLGHWWGRPSPYNLSMDATYALVQSRLNCSPEEVIDESWFNDWNDLALWKQGFSSFAQFALFRAGLREGENWWELMHLYSSDSPVDEQDALIPYDTSYKGYSDTVLGFLNSKYRSREDQTIVWGHDSTPLWFAIQDWYDPSEWHDGLAWASIWADGVNPYMFDEALDTMRGLL